MKAENIQSKGKMEEEDKLQWGSMSRLVLCIAQRKYLDRRGFGSGSDKAGRGNRDKRWTGAFIAETLGSKQG